MKKSLPEPDMNVTPLVDVVLVLLIIFMVVTPALESKVTLPTARSTSPADPNAEPIVVSISETGVMSLGEHEYPAEELESRVRTMHDAHPERRVLVKGDRRATYGIVARAMDRLQRIGVHNVGLAVKGPQEGKS